MRHSPSPAKRSTKKLKSAPDQYGERLRSPLQGLWKLKASHLRIVYTIRAETREVWILMIGNRREIWDRDQGEILKRLSGFGGPE